MTTPANPLAAELYEALAPLTYDDERRGYPLLKYINALCRPLDRVDSIVRDTDEGPGWSLVMDPDRCPEEHLSWLAQFMGVRLPPELNVDQKRLRIKETDGLRRGTPEALLGAARQYLTGTKTAWLLERHGSAYRVTVTTLESETPNPGQVLSALLEQKPAGLVLLHSVVTGGDFNSLRDTHSDFDDLTATYTDFNDMRDFPTRQ